jgi:hypothetical protein
MRAEEGDLSFAGFADKEAGGPGQNRTADTRIFNPKKR